MPRFSKDDPSVSVGDFILWGPNEDLSLSLVLGIETSSREDGNGFFWRFTLLHCSTKACGIVYYRPQVDSRCTIIKRGS